MPRPARAELLVAASKTAGDVFRAGFYMCVLREGSVARGDVFTLVEPQS